MGEVKLHEGADKAGVFILTASERKLNDANYALVKQCARLQRENAIMTRRYLACVRAYYRNITKP